ncbi:MAG: DUF805 domain-containing protein [Acidobacteria bacterium]|nr:DUF805 domain-containing protein [Acidobacteriota bacterium]
MIPYFEALKKYGVFCGRARLWEYWGFWIAHMLVSVGVIIFGIIITGDDDQILTILIGFYVLAVYVPGIAVTVRRLHDIGHSGWWYFLFFVPLIGSIVLIIWLTRDGQPGPNKYGPNPLVVAKRTTP